MSEQPKQQKPEVSPEFYVRVNDFIEMANRVERRFDTHHAQLAFVHALSRYSGHHYRSTAKVDDAANREEFAEYMGKVVQKLVLAHLEDIGGPLASGQDAAPTE